jgi:acyl transferase domain-containing protein
MFTQPDTASAELLRETAYAQPALFALGAAMHAVFVEAGVCPDYLLGHSVGELSAAYLAGVLTLPDAAALVAARALPDSDDSDDVAARLTFAAPSVPLLSNLTGEIATSEQLTSAEYWAGLLREPAHFHDSVVHLLTQGECTFVELSAHPVLAPVITDALAGVSDRPQSAVITTLSRHRPDRDTVTAALAQLHNHGHSPSWRTLYPEAGVIALPTYPFQHRSYWVHAVCQDSVF